MILAVVAAAPSGAKGLLIYTSILLVPVVLSVLLRITMKLVVRTCHACGAMVVVGRPFCQRCGYRFDLSRW